MPTDSNGNYSLPDGYRAIQGEIIQPNQHNPPLEDLRDAMTARLTRSGSGAMTGPLKIIDGTVGAPGLAFSTALSTGVVKTSAGFGIVILGLMVAEFGPAGILSGFVPSSIPDNAVAYKQIQKPSGTSKLLGTPSVAALAISGAANNGSGLIRLTVASTADLTTGQTKIVSGVVGTTEANASWTITVVSGTTVDLQGSAFANAYVSGGFLGGSIEEITMGAGVHIEKNALRVGFAPPAAFKNLAIKVGTNTTVAVTADFVTVTDGTKYQTLAVSNTINLGTTGIGGLDTGTIAAATWYAVFAIAKADGSTSVLASTSATAPTMPTDYTYKARIGWLRTAAGSAQLMGTWQLGRRAQYIVGLTQTTVLPVMANTAAGSGFAGAGPPTWGTQSVSNFVPTTASRLGISIYCNSPADVIAISPNSSYGATQSSNPPPIVLYGPPAFTGLQFEIGLESSNIYVGLATGDAIRCLGWEDNL